MTCKRYWMTLLKRTLVPRNVKIRGNLKIYLAIWAILISELSFQVDADKGSSSKPPRFLSDLTNVQSVVARGQSKILQCQAIGSPSPTYQWLLNDEPLGPFSSEHFIRLSDVSVSNSGDYRCMAKNNVGTVRSTKTTLKVAFMDHAPPPSPPSDLNVQSGDAALMIVPPLNSFPPLSVTWFSGDDTPILYDIKYATVLSTNSLVLLDAAKEDEKIYTARLTNPQLGIGSEVRTNGVRLTVEGEGLNEIPPSMITSPANLTIVKGTSISRLQCIGNARPLFRLETLWTKDGIPINRAGIKYFFNSPWNRTLALLDADVSSSGVYTCTIRLKNSIYETKEASAYVEIVVPPSISPFLPEETPTDLGTSLNIPCNAYGSPQPTIVWYKDGEEIVSLTDGYHLLVNGSLQIDSVSYSDSGVVQCMASNQVGEASTYTWIKVKTSAPVFSSPPVNVSAVGGHDAEISCGASGAPEPNITWAFNGKDLSLSDIRYQVKENGNLIVESVLSSDEGVYACVRENEAGKISDEAFLSVMVKTHIIVPPIDTRVILGHVAQLYCKVNNAPDVNVLIEWSKDGSLLPQLQHVHKRQDGTLDLQEVRATDGGAYTCRVYSSGGNDSASAWLTIMDHPYAPRLVNAERVVGVAKTAVISWTPHFDGNSPITRFIVMQREVKDKDLIPDLGLNWIPSLTNVSGSANSVHVKDLRPSTAYQFRVSAVNDVGEGPASEPSGILILPQEAPSGPPQDLVGSPRSSSEIMIQWEAPQQEDRNGVLLGYLVRYRLWGYKDAQWYYRNITVESRRNYLISGLITWKDYEIQVSSYNAKGVGVYSTPGIRIKTKEGVPLAPPREVQATALSSTSVNVQWKPPQPWLINGINQGYKLHAYKEEPTNASEASAMLQVLPSPYPDALESANLTGLDKFTSYFITVLCFTHPGNGKASLPVKIDTLEDVPDQISNLTFSEVTDRGLHVSWSSPSRQNGILKGYTLEYRKKDADRSSAFYNLTADVTNLVIDNLTASTFYTFKVYAWTSVGSGKATVSTIQSGVEPILPDPPVRLAVSNIKPFSVVLQFTPGFDGNASIDLWKIETLNFRTNQWALHQSVSLPLATTLTIINLNPYTKYKLRLVAINVVGESLPSEPSPQFQTLQAAPAHPPKDLTLRAVSPTELRVRWIPLLQSEWYGAPQGYRIKYRPTNCACPYEHSMVQDVTANSYQLGGLQEFTAYDVSVVAVNDIGMSAEAPWVTERTRDDVPSAGPSNVTAKATSSTTIVVEWSEVPELDKNGIIEGYKVVYAGPDFEPHEKVISHNFTLATTLTELRKFSHYTINVKAYTRSGDGQLSSPVLTVQTLEDVPGPPSSVSFPDVSFTYARIIWEAPTEPNGEIKAYSVQYLLMDNPNLNHTIEFGPNGRTYRAEDLKPESNYLFLVRARTRLGWGAVLKAPVYTRNNRNLPEPPSKPTIAMTQITSNSITFAWNPGKDGFAPIRYYSVQYTESTEIWHDLEIRLEYDSTSFTVSGLKPFTEYGFRIRATNDIGESEWSPSSEKVRTLPARPVRAPHNVKVIPITQDSVRVEWSPLPEELWSGDTLTGGYKIQYREVFEIQSPFDISSMVVNDTRLGMLVLENLKRDTNYEVMVEAFNAQGSSSPTPPMTVYVGEAVPTAAPTDLDGQAISPTEIKISWKPPPESKLNGELLGYKIFYRKSSQAISLTEVEIVPPMQNSFEFLYLDMWTQYTISLLCYNPAGEGPSTAPLVLRTKESSPGVIGNMTFSDITMNSLKVSWNEPMEPNGLITGYLVTYETAYHDENFSKEVKQKVESTYLLVTSLKEEVTYQFSVKAETIRGFGPEVKVNVTTGPQPGSPARPKDVGLSKTVSSLTLHWRNSHTGQGPILGYYIEAKRKDGDSWTVLMKTETGALEEYTVSFQNLLPSTHYKFRLIAYNYLGISFPAVAKEMIVTPSKVYMEYGYLQQHPFYHQTWFMVTLAALSVVIIIVVVAALCVKSKTIKYKHEAQSKSLEDSLGPDDTCFPSYEMQPPIRGSGTLTSKRGTINRSTINSRRRSAGTLPASVLATKSPPRPAPSSVAYSDDDTVKGYDQDDDDDSSDLTEKPSDVSTTDSQINEGSDTESECGPSPPGAVGGSHPPVVPLSAQSPSTISTAGTSASYHNHSFVNHYANINDTLRQSWRRQKPQQPQRNYYSSYTDSDHEGSQQISLNGGQIIMNNMAGSRAPLPGFSSFV